MSHDPPETAAKLPKKTAAAHPGGYDLIVIAASAGGLEALETILFALPADFPVPIAIVQHRTAQQPNLLAQVLGRFTLLPVKNAEKGERMHPGTVYLAPPDLHLTVRPDKTFGLQDGTRIRHVRSSANPLFETAAEALGDRVIAVVLTGGDHDGTDGVQTVQAHGGIVLAQDEATSRHFGMPGSAIETGCVSEVLPIQEIAPTLLRLVKPPAAGKKAGKPRKRAEA